MSADDEAQAQARAWPFTPAYYQRAWNAQVQDTEFELAQLTSDFGCQPPWGEDDIEAAMTRNSIKYAASRAALDGRLLIAWLLRRYYRRISPDYCRRRLRDHTT